jgi:hypothetical protein
MVIERHFNQPGMKNLRQDIEHIEDRQRTALSLAEYIQKEGDEQWVDKILEELGPWLMIQLADMANFFEVLRKLVEYLLIVC